MKQPFMLFIPAFACFYRESSAGRGQASEAVQVYFEDSNVNAGIMNLGIRKVRLGWG